MDTDKELDILVKGLRLDLNESKKSRKDLEASHAKRMKIKDAQFERLNRSIDALKTKEASVNGVNKDLIKELRTMEKAKAEVDDKYKMIKEGYEKTFEDNKALRGQQHEVLHTNEHLNAVLADERKTLREERASYRRLEQSLSAAIKEQDRLKAAHPGHLETGIEIEPGLRLYGTRAACERARDLINTPIAIDKGKDNDK